MPCRYGAQVNFAEFQATGRDVPDLGKFPHFAAQDVTGPGRAYLDYGLFIQSDTFSDGKLHWFVTISNGGRESLDLADCERELYEFAISEGYVS